MIYKIDGVDITGFGAFPILSGEKTVCSGIFDCPKRKSPTERSWDTEIEPFVDPEDIEFEKREFRLMFAMPTSSNFLNAFKQSLIDCTLLEIGLLSFDVICKHEINVITIGQYHKIEVRFIQTTYELASLITIPSGNGDIKIDNYNLHDDFGIHSSADQGFRSIGPRIEVATTEEYLISSFRDFRELSINCFMVGSSYTDLHNKMSQFHALLYQPGMRTLVVDSNSYSCYCKSGFKSQMVAENLLKFTLKLQSND